MCHLLPNKCIFCDKEVKYVKIKREFLWKSVLEEAKGKILHHAKEKNDFHLIALTSANDLIAAETQYHPSCYADYTRPVTGKKVVENSDYQKLELEAFHEVIKHCHDIILLTKYSSIWRTVVNYEKSFFKKQFIDKSIHEKESEEEYSEMLRRQAEIYQC